MASPAGAGPSCPAWCRSDPCRRDHWEPKTYLPATGGTPHEVDPEGGAQYPVVGVGLDHSELDGHDAPSVMLHVIGPRGDWDLLLRPAEAEALGHLLLERVSLLRADRG